MEKSKPKISSDSAFNNGQRLKRKSNRINHPIRVTQSVTTLGTGEPKRKATDMKKRTTDTKNPRGGAQLEEKCQQSAPTFQHNDVEPFSVLQSAEQSHREHFQNLHESPTFSYKVPQSMMHAFQFKDSRTKLQHRQNTNRNKSNCPEKGHHLPSRKMPDLFNIIRSRKDSLVEPTKDPSAPVKDTDPSEMLPEIIAKYQSASSDQCFSDRDLSENTLSSVLKGGYSTTNYSNHYSDCSYSCSEIVVKNSDAICYTKDMAVPENDVDHQKNAAASVECLR